MSGPKTVIPEGKCGELRRRLFVGNGLNAYAVLDGASIPELLPKLEEFAPEQVCLYRGELEPDLAECAPYLVQLEPDSPFTDFVLNEGWGKHWGIFALSSADLASVRKHFRTFLMVKSPEGKKLYFRYYDPRVFRVYLPTCNAEEIAILFGPITSYLLEPENPAALLKFSQNQGLLLKETISLEES